MALKTSKWEIPLLIALVFSAMGAFGLASFSIMDHTIGESIMMVVPLGLAMSYMISERQMQRMSNIETFSFIVPIIIVFLHQSFDGVQTFATNWSPYFGLVVVGMVAFAFYALTNEDI